MQWENGEKLDDHLIREMERYFGFRLPLDFVNVVKQYDGGRPVQYFFDYDRRKRVMFGELLSFNPNKKFNAVSAYGSLYEDEDIELPKELVPFALDPAGNLYCFDYSQDNIRPSVVFVDHEGSEDVDYICDTFTDLVNKLYLDR
ncbi:SUKH superfamily protein [Desmospora activa DSM 45169]|uniref:SUKH superfamily protein n=2 Tax=Desmospora TaxID=500614 RepID=A0A2T4Z6N3_9BACL|nr:SUKH superfamily protein [Desmospora activa DSM 45169]